MNFVKSHLSKVICHWLPSPALTPDPSTDGRGEKRERGEKGEGRKGGEGSPASQKSFVTNPHCPITNPQSPIPSHQSPVTNPQSPIPSHLEGERDRCL